MAMDENAPANVDETCVVILQSLICLMREKNILDRADVEELRAKVERRMAADPGDQLPCCPAAARNASGLMDRLTSYIGRRYGGKHAGPMRSRS